MARFQRTPESREKSIWDTMLSPEGDYGAKTAWAAPTYEWWYPYPYTDPNAKGPSLSPMEKLLDPNARVPSEGATPSVPNLATGGVPQGEGFSLPVEQPSISPSSALSGLVGLGLSPFLDAGSSEIVEAGKNIAGGGVGPSVAQGPDASGGGVTPTSMPLARS